MFQFGQKLRKQCIHYVINLRLQKFMNIFIFLACVGLILTLLILAELFNIENNTEDPIISVGIDKAQVLHEALEIYKDELNLTRKQFSKLKRLTNNNLELCTIYVITPTYWRYVQKAELTRIHQTLRLVRHNIHWILVEDSDTKTDVINNFVKESTLTITHLFAKTPWYIKLASMIGEGYRHRGIEQRNMGLQWLRNNLVYGKDTGVVYFMDDDNTYSVKLFDEIAKVKKIGIWPVGFIGRYTVETPIVDPNTGKVTGYYSEWHPEREFAIDMAGFAINLNLILSKTDAEFNYNVAVGFQEEKFLSNFIVTKYELDPLADNCTKVYVWHTKTEEPKIEKIIHNYVV